MRPRDYSAARITLVYAVISALWIFLSDRMISGISDIQLTALLQTTKGLVFVVVTSILLYALIKHDIDRIYRTETRMRILFDSVNDAILLFRLDTDGVPAKILDANDVAVRRLGWTLPELLSMSPRDVIHPDLLPEALDAWRRLRIEGRVVLETVQVAKDQRAIPVEISARVVRLDHSDLVVSIVRDITERKQLEESRRQEALAAEEDKRRFHRETILAVTQGKFEICDKGQLDEWMSQPDLVVDVQRPEELSKARRAAVSYCRERGLPEASTRDFELAIGEALANAVKHVGSGILMAGKDEEAVWVAVCDKGPGIDTFALPNLALTSGYSTKASMGLGYTLILDVSDAVKLATGSSGTTVVMYKRFFPPSEKDQQIARFIGIQ